VISPAISWSFPESEEEGEGEEDFDSGLDLGASFDANFVSISDLSSVVITSTS
jgi:hypothetical protein